MHDAVEEDIFAHFECIAAFIADARNVEANVLGAPAQNLKYYFINTLILVHCREGKSRSVSSVIAFLMLKMNKTLKEAHDHVLTCAFPTRNNR